jgi:hypothetical protein
VGRICGSRRSRRRRGLAAAPLVLALFAFLAQVVLGSAHRPVVSSEAAALSLALGADAPVCTHSQPDDKTHDRGCGDLCPLCQFASHAALAAPELIAPPGLRLAAPERLGVEAARDGPRSVAGAFAEARGPPLAV